MSRPADAARRTHHAAGAGRAELSGVWNAGMFVERHVGPAEQQSCPPGKVKTRHRLSRDMKDMVGLRERLSFRSLA